MKCPNCYDRSHVDIEPGDGFTERDTRECLTCGAVWCFSEVKQEIKIIKAGNPALKKED